MTTPYTLNGNPVENGYQIATEGSWTLVASTATEPNAITINFTTIVSVANQAAPGRRVRSPRRDKSGLRIDLDDATKKIWISSSSGGHFDGGDDETVASGDVIGMTAPMLPGPYIIYVLAEDGEVLEPVARSRCGKRYDACRYSQKWA